MEGWCPIPCPKMVLLVRAGSSHQACGDHMGTMQERHKNDRWIISLPFSHPLLASHLLPGDKGCLSAPHSPISAWAQTGGWLRAWGFFATPPLALCCTGITIPQHPGRAPKSSPASPTHILAVQARFAILTRFALGGKKGSEGALQVLQQPGTPAARGAWAPLEPQGGAGHRASPA